MLSRSHNAIHASDISVDLHIHQDTQTTVSPVPSAAHNVIDWSCIILSTQITISLLLNDTLVSHQVTYQGLVPSEVFSDHIEAEPTVVPLAILNLRLLAVVSTVKGVVNLNGTNVCM